LVGKVTLVRDRMKLPGPKGRGVGSCRAVPGLKAGASTVVPLRGNKCAYGLKPGVFLGLCGTAEAMS
jgi:hypothetical protein